MTGDRSLHQAALLVKGAELNLRKLFQDIEPLLREHVARVHEVIGSFPKDNQAEADEAWDRVDEEDGFRQLVHNLFVLEHLAPWVDNFVSALSRGEEAPPVAA